MATANPSRMSIPEQKTILRRTMLEAARKVTPAERAEAGRRMMAHLREQAVWTQAQTVLLYAPMSGEPDLFPLIGEALAAGKVVSLPWFDRSRKEYGARTIRTVKDLESGHVGILEPGPSSPEIMLNQLDFVLVPGVAYDRQGCRLGRGKGYYDRLLARVPGHTCGTGFDWQMTPTVPREPHDVVLKSLLTPSSWKAVPIREAG